MLSQYDTKFVATNDVTIADFQLYFELTNLIVLKQNWENYPAITAWYNAVSENEAVKKVNEQWNTTIAPFIGMLNKEE